MLGLGWVELLIIGAVICLIAGPAAIPKIVESVKSLDKAKNELTGKNALKKLLLEDDAGGDRDDRPAPSSDDDDDQGNVA